MRYLLFILSLLCCSCSIYNLAAKVDSGTMIGDSDGDCMNIQEICSEKNGRYDYNYNPEPEDEWLCTCSW